MWRLKKILESEKIRYLIVGGMTTLVNLALFHFLADVLHLDVTLSNVISIIVSIIFAFFANKVAVFKSKSTELKSVVFEFIKFIGGRGITMIIEVGGVYLLYNVIGTTALLAKIITQTIVIILNYFISKYLVFKASKR